MRKIRRLLSMFLTIAMAVSLLDVTAFGLRLKLDDDTFDLQISSDEGKVSFLATYDAETGQMRSVSRNGFLSWEKGTVLQSMMVDGDSYAPIDWAVRSYIDQDGRRTIDFENDHSRRYDLVGTGTVYLNRVNHCDVTLNGVQIGGAHVFGYEQPYGVYIQSLNGTVDADDMSVTLYAGQWDEDKKDAVFGLLERRRFPGARMG